MNRNKQPWLHVVWEEEDGPPVKKPRSSGFGSKLITGGLPGAKVKHQMLPTGVVCDIELPLGAGESK